MGIFETPDEPKNVDDNTFWEHVVPRKVEQGKPFVTHKSHVDFSPHEIVAAEMLGLRTPKEEETKTSPVVVIDLLDEVNSDDEGEEFDDLSVQTVKTVQSRDSAVSAASNNTVTESVADDVNDLIAVGGMEIQSGFVSPRRKLSKKEDQKNSLKKLGNVQRCKINMQCTHNQFVEGRKKLKDIATERMKEREKEQRKIELIWDAVHFFKKKMKKNTLALNEILEKYDEERNVHVKDWEIDYEDSRTLFNEDPYLKGELF